MEAHRHPWLRPAVEESLAEFLARLADKHAWPAESRDADLALALALLRDLASGEQDAADSGSHVLRALSFTADPAMGLRHLDRYLRALEARAPAELRALRDNTEHLHFLCSLFSFSDYLSEVVIAHPDFLEFVLKHSRLNREKSLENYRDSLTRWLDNAAPSDLRNALILFKKRELLRIGVRELREMGDTQALCRELSNLAAVLIERAYGHCRAAVEASHGVPAFEEDSRAGQPGFAVYAMGKFGAGELNFSSDVDLVFVYDEEGMTTGIHDAREGRMVRRTSNHEYFNKLARELCAFLSGRVEEGFLLRVDARLRPDGDSGPLARAKPAYSSYFSGHAALWEKIAWLKARAVCGDMLDREEFDRVIERFVYVDNRREDLLPEIARLKRRIDHDALTEESRELDIKRGLGGIREIEFIVCALQLLNAEKFPSLRLRSTLGGLAQVVHHGLLPAETAARLRECYLLFRRVEHTLQMMHESQTHRLPAERAAREALALRCGFLDPLHFEAKLSESRLFVRGEFERHFDERTPAGEMTLADWLFAEREPPPAVFDQLRGAGLGDAEGYRLLRSLAVGTREYAPSAQGQVSFARLVPDMVEELAEVAQPRQAIRHFDLLLRSSRSFSAIYSLCLSHRPILRMLMRTLGCGQLLGRHLGAHPEWLDEIMLGDGLQESRTARALAEWRPPGRGTDRETRLRAIRMFKNLEAFLISMQEVLGVCTSAAGAQRMTQLAEAVIAAVADVERDEVLAPLGETELPVRWALIGLGGLGDREVHLSADLDVAFVVEEDTAWHGQSSVLWVDKIACGIMATLGAVSPEGQLWKVDARLRPDGQNGPLASAATQYYRYYQDDAGLWEWQALTKARAIAGDLAFGSGVLHALHQLWARRGAPANLRTEVATMRRRIEESVKLPRKALVDIKRGPGGLVDIEFLLQYLVLGCASDAPALFPLTTGQMIEALLERRVLSSTDARFLRDHLGFLRILQRTLRLLHETSRDYFPAEPERRAELRRAVADQFTDRRLRHFDRLEEELAAMRTLFERHLG